MRAARRWLGRAGWRGLPGLLFLSCGARGQNAPAGPAWVLKLTPQYLVLSGCWLEVEHRGPRHPRQSFSFTPQLYAGPAGRPDATPASSQNPYYQPILAEPATVRGLGLQVQHRVYLRPAPAAHPVGLYVSYGLNFQHFAVSADGALAWQVVTGPDGLPYHEYRRDRYTETINRYGVTGQLGYQLPLAPGARVLLDLYAGLGWRTGQSRAGSASVASRYDSGPSDYGHQGLYFPVGFRIGVALK